MNVLNMCLRPKALVALAAVWLAISFIALLLVVWPFTLLIAAECAVCLVLLMGALEMVGELDYANCNARPIGIGRGPASSRRSARRPAGRMRVLPPRSSEWADAVAAHRRVRRDFGLGNSVAKHRRRPRRSASLDHEAVNALGRPRCRPELLSRSTPG
jgi:hypothetical protein